MEGDVVYQLEITPEALDAFVKLFDENVVLSAAGRRIKISWRAIGGGRVILEDKEVK